MRNNKIATIIGCVIIVIVVAAAGLKIYLSRPVSAIVIPPAPAVPLNNGFDDCVRAVSLLKDADTAEKLGPDQRQEARALLDSNREAMETIRQAFGKQYITPRVKRWDQKFPYLRGYRSIGGLFRLEGQLKASSGDISSAVESYLDARRFGTLIPIGGSTMHWIVAQMVSKRGYTGLEEISAKLDKTQCRYVLRELQKADMREPLFGEVLAEEEAIGLMCLRDTYQGSQRGPDGKMSGPIHPMIDRLMSRGKTSIEEYQAYMSQYRAESSKPFYLRKPPADPKGVFSLILAPPASLLTRKSTSATQGQILKLMIALRLHYLEHGRYPASLTDMKSSSLIFMDEFTGEPLVYKPSRNDYLLYSVGPDGKDDGGTPPKTAKDKFVGDLVAGKLFSAREEPPK